MSENKVSKSMDSKKRSCFIITPIGDEGTEIRRHIDGIIDAAIIPVLENEFDVKAAHHINEPGNITKQIIKQVYECDLVIANLTGRNPNVMYELALRHSIGKPTIMICDKETTLPSDIISERTNFYINDSKGVLELRKKIKKCLNEIDFENTERKSPIYDALSEIEIESILVKKVQKENPQDAEILSLILDRIDSLENKIATKNRKKLMEEAYESFQIEISFDKINKEEIKSIVAELMEESKKSLMHALIEDPQFQLTPISISIILIFDKGIYIEPRIASFVEIFDEVFGRRKIEFRVNVKKSKLVTA